MIETLLIANRGEIACRIARTCRRLGIRSVAVYAEPDADSLLTTIADEAVCIGPAQAAASYLNTDAILDAARATGADAIHPGYGFLAENAAFARAVRDAGLRWVGPSPEAIDAMGSKRHAKATAVRANVPTLPGYHGAAQDDATLHAEAQRIGFPLLVKASAGGGGKGMRIVHEAAGLDEAIAGARREALAAFGDDTLLLERYLVKPRHIEVQILGDEDGVVAVFERECSVQRRHQKVVEEAPSPTLTPSQREEVCAAAVRLGTAIGYTNAGTVEFVLDADGAFYFLEVNTRLQVEHPVTECITGLDLVEQQLRIASGGRIDRHAIPAAPVGHAVEVRVYAEDVPAGFLPATGVLLDWHVGVAEGVRVDTGVRSGSTISVHYDPMIAKIIAHGRDREEALRRLRRALDGTSAVGVVTNLAMLRGLVRDDAFTANAVHTQWLESLPDAALHAWGDDAAARGRAREACLAAAVLERASLRRVLPRVRAGFRAHGRVERTARFADHPVSYTILSGHADAVTLALDDGTIEATRLPASMAGTGTDSAVRIAVRHADGVTRRYRVVDDGTQCAATGLDGCHAFAWVPRFPAREVEAVAGGCLAPMPGTIVAVRVAVGDRVEVGDAIAVLEAMKMEHTVRASVAGVVDAVLVAEQAQVEADALLAVIEADAP
jgi:acetyl/propionyl-CoA carboxylase alpha subunit